MNYQTFVNNTTATLSVAALMSMSVAYQSEDFGRSYQSLSNAPYSIYSGATNKTYNQYEKISNISVNEDIEAVIAFADKLIGNSKPLDADIAKLIDDNLMDLLS
jgi:hypothetical protein